MMNRSEERNDVALTLELSCSTGESPWPKEQVPLLAVNQRLELYVSGFESDGGYMTSIKEGDLPVLANTEHAKVTVVISSPKEHVYRFAVGTRARLAAAQYHLADVEITSVTPEYWGRNELS